MQKTQLALKEQIGLVLGVLLFFSLADSFAGYRAADQGTAKMAAFASERVTTTGKITNKYIHIVTRVWVYWLDLDFKTEDGVTHHVSENLANTIYDSYNVGDPVQVTYARSNPQWFYIAGTAPTQRDLGISSMMLQIGIFSGAFCLFGIIVLLLWKRDDGGSRDNKVAPLEYSTSPKRSPSCGPRATFGTRRG